VYLIDGALVAVDNGDRDAIDAQIEAESTAIQSGTPSAVPPVLFGDASCAGPIAKMGFL
jgi:hypothetical protein